jgi:1-acyl-sn-glycerol-3-phosphate acyltransferase
VTEALAPRPLPGWRRAIRVCMVTSSFVWFWGGAVVLAWTAFPAVALFVRDPVRRMRACQRLVSATFRVFHGYMRVLGLLDAVVTGEIERPMGGPVVLVANHTTLVDVTAILTRFTHACCLTKPAFVDHVLFGRLLRLSGFISAGTDTASRAAALKMAQERLEQGFDVLVFPEGTRSPPHDLLPFHRGAFEIACRARVPVVPLLLRCSPSALTRDRPFWKQPDTVAILTVEARAAVDPSVTEYRGAALRTRVETSYREALGLSVALADAVE